MLKDTEKFLQREVSLATARVTAEAGRVIVASAEGRLNKSHTNLLRNVLDHLDQAQENLESVKAAFGSNDD